MTSRAATTLEIINRQDITSTDSRCRDMLRIIIIVYGISSRMPSPQGMQASVHSQFRALALPLVESSCRSILNWPAVQPQYLERPDRGRLPAPVVILSRMAQNPCKSKSDRDTGWPAISSSPIKIYADRAERPVPVVGTPGRGGAMACFPAVLVTRSGLESAFRVSWTVLERAVLSLVGLLSGFIVYFVWFIARESFRSVA